MDDAPPLDDDLPSDEWLSPPTRKDVATVAAPQRDHTTAPHPIAGDVAAAVETGRRQGYDEGYNAGFADGRTVGLRDGRQTGRDEAIAALIRVFRAKYGPTDRGYVNVVGWVRNYLGHL